MLWIKNVPILSPKVRGEGSEQDGNKRPKIRRTIGSRRRCLGAYARAEFKLQATSASNPCRLQRARLARCSFYPRLLGASKMQYLLQLTLNAFHPSTEELPVCILVPINCLKPFLG